MQAAHALALTYLKIGETMLSAEDPVKAREVRDPLSSALDHTAHPATRGMNAHSDDGLEN